MSLQCTTLAPVWFGCTGLGWAGLDGAITVVFDVWMMVDCMFKFDFDFLPLFSLSEPLCAVSESGRIYYTPAPHRHPPPPPP